MMTLPNWSRHWLKQFNSMNQIYHWKEISEFRKRKATEMI